MANFDDALRAALMRLRELLLEDFREVLREELRAALSEIRPPTPLKGYRARDSGGDERTAEEIADEILNRSRAVR